MIRFAIVIVITALLASFGPVHAASGQVVQQGDGAGGASAATAPEPTPLDSAGRDGSVEDVLLPDPPDCADTTECNITSPSLCRWDAFRRALADPAWAADPKTACVNHLGAGYDAVDRRLCELGIIIDGTVSAHEFGEQACLLLPDCGPGDPCPAQAYLASLATGFVDRVRDQAFVDPGPAGYEEQPREAGDPSGFNISCSHIRFVPDSDPSDPVDDSFLYVAWDIADFDEDINGNGFPVPYDSDDNADACLVDPGVLDTRDYFTEAYRVNFRACANLTVFDPRNRLTNGNLLFNADLTTESMLDERTSGEDPLMTYVRTPAALDGEVGFRTFPTADDSFPGTGYAMNFGRNACINLELDLCRSACSVTGNACETNADCGGGETCEPLSDDRNNVELVIKEAETLGIFGPHPRLCSTAGTPCLEDADCPAGETCERPEPGSQEAFENRIALTELVAVLEASTDGDFSDEEFANVAIRTSLPDIEVTKGIRCLDPEEPAFHRHLEATPGATYEFQIIIKNWGNEDLAVTVFDLYEAVLATVDVELDCTFFQAFLTSERRRSCSGLPANNACVFDTDCPAGQTCDGLVDYPVTFANAAVPPICTPGDLTCLEPFFFFPSCTPPSGTSFLEMVNDPATFSAYAGTLLGADAEQDANGVCTFFDGDQLELRFRGRIDIEHVCANDPTTICENDADCLNDTGPCVPNLDDFCQTVVSPDAYNKVKVEGAILPLPETEYLPFPATCNSDAECDDGLWCTGDESCNLGTNTCERTPWPRCAVDLGCFEDPNNPGTGYCGTHDNDVTVCGTMHACDAADTVDTPRERVLTTCTGSDEFCDTDADCPAGETCTLKRCDGTGAVCTDDGDCAAGEYCGIDDNVVDIDLLCHNASVEKDVTCDDPRAADGITPNPAAVWHPDKVQALPGAKVAFRIEFCNDGEFDITSVDILDSWSCPPEWYITESVVATIEDGVNPSHDVTACICDDGAGGVCETLAEMNGTKTFAACPGAPPEPYIEPGECLVITFEVLIPLDYDTMCLDPDCTNTVLMTGSGSSAVCGPPLPPAGGEDEAEIDIIVPELSCNKEICADLDLDGNCDTPWSPYLQIDPNSITTWPIWLMFRTTTTNTGETDLGGVQICDLPFVDDVNNTPGVDFVTPPLCPLDNASGCMDCGTLDKGDPCATPPLPGDSCTAQCTISVLDYATWEIFATTDDDGDANCYTNVPESTGAPVVGPDVCPSGITVGDICPATVCLQVLLPCRPITKALFDIWNENEVRFSGTERCIFSWDQALLDDDYAVFNHLIRSSLQTDKGKARIDGVRDIAACSNESIDAPLLGVAAKVLTFQAPGVPDRVDWAGMNLVAMGTQAGFVEYDILGGIPPELGLLGNDPVPPTDLTGTTPEAAPAGAAAMLNGAGTDRPDVTEPGGDGVTGERTLGLCSTTKKGSFLVFTKVEIKWDDAGNLIQDTFIDLTNDYPYPVKVQMYFVRLCGEYVDNEILLTGNEPAYWSVATGAPKGVSPFGVLGPPFPDPSGTGTYLPGYVLAWAVDEQTNEPIRWNHLKGDALIVNYQDNSAWEHSAWTFAALAGGYNGDTLLAPEWRLDLDGSEYDAAPDLLLLDFYSYSGTEPTFVTPDGTTEVFVNTDLTLWAARKDLRQH